MSVSMCCLPALECVHAWADCWVVLTLCAVQTIAALNRKNAETPAGGKKGGDSKKTEHKKGARTLPFAVPMPVAALFIII